MFAKPAPITNMKQFNMEKGENMSKNELILKLKAMNIPVNPNLPRKSIVELYDDSILKFQQKMNMSATFGLALGEDKKTKRLSNEANKRAENYSPIIKMTSADKKKNASNFQIYNSTNFEITGNEKVSESRFTIKREKLVRCSTSKKNSEERISLDKDEVSAINFNETADLLPQNFNDSNIFNLDTISVIENMSQASTNSFNIVSFKLPKANQTKKQQLELMPEQITETSDLSEPVAAPTAGESENSKRSIIIEDKAFQIDKNTIPDDPHMLANEGFSNNYFRNFPKQPNNNAPFSSISNHRSNEAEDTIKLNLNNTSLNSLHTRPLECPFSKANMFDAKDQSKSKGIFWLSNMNANSIVFNIDTNNKEQNCLFQSSKDKSLNETMKYEIKTSLSKDFSDKISKGKPDSTEKSQSRNFDCKNSCFIKKLQEEAVSRHNLKSNFYSNERISGTEVNLRKFSKFNPSRCSFPNAFNSQLSNSNETILSPEYSKSSTILTTNQEKEDKMDNKFVSFMVSTFLLFIAGASASTIYFNREKISEVIEGSDLNLNHRGEIDFVGRNQLRGMLSQSWYYLVISIFAFVLLKILTKMRAVLH